MKRVVKHVIGIAAVVALVIVLARSGLFGGAVDRAVTDVSTPVMDVLGFPGRLLGDSFKTIARNRALRAENARLRARVSELERLYNSRKGLEQRCRRLEELVHLQEEYQYDALPARIVLKDDMSWSKTIVINRGRKDGLMPNMAVISGAGLVGKIIETGYAYSRVLLVVDKTFKAGARLRASRYAGLIEGQGVDRLVLNYLPRDAMVAQGDEVVTSGLGGVFPAGYLIGTVKRALFEEYGFYQYATVRPAVDLNTLEMVAVVKRLPPQIDLPDPGAE